MATRTNIALAVALAAWAAMAVFVLPSDEGSSASGVLTLGIWALALGYAVWFVAVAPDRRSPRVVAVGGAVLVVLFAAMVALFVLAFG